MEKSYIVARRNIGFSAEDMRKIDEIKNHFGLNHRIEAIRIAITSKANELKEGM